MSIEVILRETDDRVVEVTVTDQYGQVYRIGLEFLNHSFRSDEVQVLVHKMPADWKKQLKEKGSCCTYSPNRILHTEETVDVRRVDGNGEEHHCYPSIWFEFHEIEGYPQINSEDNLKSPSLIIGKETSND